MKILREASLERGMRGGQIGLAATGAKLWDVPLWKRGLDLGVVILAAPIWLPVMFVIGVAIKFLSPGPVLFRQERIGLGGGRFICLKFRTMHAGASVRAHEEHLTELIRSNRPMKKLDGNDSRLIPLAWVLRSTGLDELPQLFNVLRGEMSLVGPRPGTLREYAACSPAQRARVGTLPGLTGLWQVSGKNSTTFNEMIALDLRYLRKQCFWGDVRIMLRTPVVLMAQIKETILDRKTSGLATGVPWPDLIQQPRSSCANSARVSVRNAPERAMVPRRSGHLSSQAVARPVTH